MLTTSSLLIQQCYRNCYSIFCLQILHPTTTRPHTCIPAPSSRSGGGHLSPQVFAPLLSPVEPLRSPVERNAMDTRSKVEGGLCATDVFLGLDYNAITVIRRMDTKEL